MQANGEESGEALAAGAGREEAATAVWEVIAVHLPDPPSEREDGIRLGEDGLGLDSIAIAEVLLALEELFGIDPEELLDRDGLTVGALVDHAVRR